MRLDADGQAAFYPTTFWSMRRAARSLSHTGQRNRDSQEMIQSLEAMVKTSVQTITR